MDPSVRFDNDNNNKDQQELIYDAPPPPSIQQVPRMLHTSNGSSHLSSPSTRHWKICREKFPKSEIVYFIQVILVYIVVIVSIVNLTLGRPDDKLWIALLSSSIGYILPSPNLLERTANKQA